MEIDWFPGMSAQRVRRRMEAAMIEDAKSELEGGAHKWANFALAWSVAPRNGTDVSFSIGHRSRH